MLRVLEASITVASPSCPSPIVDGATYRFPSPFPAILVTAVCEDSRSEVSGYDLKERRMLFTSQVFSPLQLSLVVSVQAVELCVAVFLTSPVGLASFVPISLLAG